MLYVSSKFLHLLAVILWIGPPLGAYYFLFRAHRSKDETAILWCERMAERIFLFEHVALAVLIATGLLLVQQLGWELLALPWLKKKLTLFVGVLLFECYDIWFAHRFVKRLLAEEVPLSDPRWTRAARLRRGLVIGAVPVGGLLLPLILWFAISKH